MTADDVAFAGLAAQAEMVRAGKISPRELVGLYLARIERLEPRLNAFRVVLSDRALAEAEDAEKRRSSGDAGPLNGVPIALKDNHDLAGEVTTHGTACFDEQATADAEIVRRVREAGAIVIGKTNLPELATSPFTESDTYGITRNPWDTDRTPNGSSGGSAVAVAAGLAAAASASDGAGSIRGPAAWCGLFGLKPQRGRVSLAPDTEHWHGLTVYGCLTRTVADTALWLDVTAGSLDSDVDAAPPPDRPFAEAAATSPGKLRVATSVKAPRALAPPIIGDDVKGAVERMGEVLRSLGHTVERSDPDYGGVGNQMVPLYLNGIREDCQRLPHSERAMRYTRGLSRLGGVYPTPVIRRAKRQRETYASRINKLFDDFDVLVTCVAGTAAHEVARWEGCGAVRTLMGYSRIHPFNIVWNYVGNPSCAVPAGFTDDGLPLAVQIVGRPNDEATLLSLAAQLEAELRWPDKRPPVS
jgi:amidase